MDPKTVERWITKKRTPHRRIAMAAAARLSEDPAYLWPELGRRPVLDTTYGEIITVYPERHAVPNSLWLTLLQAADRNIDLLVYAGLHLPEANPAWPKEIQARRAAARRPGSRSGTLTPPRSGPEDRRKASGTAWPPASTTRWPGTGRCSQPRTWPSGSTPPSCTTPSCGSMTRSAG